MKEAGKRRDGVKCIIITGLHRTPNARPGAFALRTQFVWPCVFLLCFSFRFARAARGNFKFMKSSRTRPLTHTHTYTTDPLVRLARRNSQRAPPCFMYLYSFISFFRPECDLKVSRRNRREASILNLNFFSSCPMCPTISLSKYKVDQ